MEAELSYEEVCASVTLPDWVEIPSEMKVVVQIIQDEDGFWADVPTHGIYRSKYLDDVYDMASSFVEDVLLPEGFDLLFAVTEEQKQFFRNPFRILPVFTDQDALDLLKYGFHQAQKAIEAFRQKPSFLRAYHMLDSHPAFWTRYEEEPTFEWETEGHADRLWKRPMSRGDGTFVWAIEAGQHIGPDYRYHYHDLRLDVYGPTIEEAYISLAHLMLKFFNDDGTEIPDVEYEKSELELILEERVRDLNLPEEG